MRLIRRFLADESGATALEYTLIAMAIAVGIAALVGLVGSRLQAGGYIDLPSLVI